jgi:signal transduction histidine kinase
MLSSQENERTTISRSLHDDVAQAMLGIQVRLAHLKKEAARNTTGLNKELTATQRLVKKSAETLERFAGKLT